MADSPLRGSPVCAALGVLHVIKLELRNPHWIKGEDDDPEDQCAHGHIKFIIDDLVISDGSEDWTVSAAALFLLRTIDFDHSKEEPVSESNYLIPCCGFNPFKTEGNRFDLLLMGCNHGINPEVIHSNEGITFRHSGETRTVPKSDWALAVSKFTNQVLAFYKSSSVKVSVTDKYDREGWQLFWQELNQRNDMAQKLANLT